MTADFAQLNSGMEKARVPAARTTAEYRVLDAAHHIHPFTDMDSLNFKGSRVITEAQGVYLKDSDGNRIIDGMAGLWCVNVGYGRKELIDAATRQLHALPFYNTFFQSTHPPVIELSALLAELVPGDFSHFFYCNSGSEGNDTVLRIVHQYWIARGKPSRKYVISRENAYHGSTIAGATLGGMVGMHNQMLSRVEFIEYIGQPCYFGEAGAGMTPEEFGLLRARELEAKILELGAENVGAFIGEPFQGAGGVIVPPSTYWPEIERICRKYDVLLVADEVIGGFGRTGEWFAHQHFGFEPDLITMAKGLTSGYVPMGAVGVHARIATELAKGGVFTHGVTYSGHPVAAAVAVANLHVLRDERIIERVKADTGPYFQRKLREALAGHPLVGEVAGVGLVAGIQIADAARGKALDNGYEAAIACRDASYDLNLIMRPTGDRMTLSPPLIVSHGEIDEIVTKAKAAVDAAARQSGFA
nr:aspartate aminotransferase family protein [Paraburkholderia oxyphila]